MHDYTPAAKLYWWATFILGMRVLGFAAAQAAMLEGRALFEIVGRSAVAAMTGLFPVRIPGRKTSVAGAEIFVFLLLLLHGPGAAAIAAASEAAVGSWRTSKRMTSRLGSPAMAALAMYGCGSAFKLIATATFGADSAGATMVALLATALGYFASNTLLMASLLSLKQGVPVRPLAAVTSRGWLAVSFAASACIAGLVWTTNGVFGAIVLLLAVPIIAMFLSTMYLFFRQAENDSRLAEEAARHVLELRASEQRFHSAFTHAAVGMLLVSRDGRILQPNPAICQVLGMTESDLTGKRLEDIVHADDMPALRTAIGELLQGRSPQFATELRCTPHGGTAVWVSSSGALFSADGAEGHCLIMQMQDITARKQAEARLQHIAFHDGLTNLPNRSFFLAELARAVAAAQRDSSQMFAVMFLDFDRFKTINDSLGHSAGDELLSVSAQRLRQCLRPTDVIARLGGDEFAILMEHIRSDDEVCDIADRIQRALSEPLWIGGAEVTTSASIGITTSAMHYSAPEDVMRDADIAMYAAKAEGKARYARFDRAAHVEASSQLWMEGELRRALDNDHLTVEYQPIFDLRTRELYGLEALARWIHPEHGMLMPDRFIPLAEKTGLIVPLGHQVLRKSCEHVAQWRRMQSRTSALCLHVNVSPVQLAEADFALRALQIMSAADMPTRAVTLEVTEGVLMGRFKAALPNLEALRDAGVRISIDDFGKGYRR
jgi:diguanylate cyclase (GGDEF)-like protein/PAS domain S-box-containing protein